MNKRACVVKRLKTPQYLKGRGFDVHLGKSVSEILPTYLHGYDNLILEIKSSSAVN
jgi:hypothetical protein